MTGTRIRQCPRCELRFTSSSELEDHLSNDHPAPQLDRFPPTIVVAPPPPPRAEATAPSTDPKVQSVVSRRRRWTPWLLVAGGLIVIAAVLWAAATPAALAAVALIVALGAAHAWRAPVRARQRRSADAEDSAVQQRQQPEKPR